MRRIILAGYAAPMEGRNAGWREAVAVHGQLDVPAPRTECTGLHCCIHDVGTGNGVETVTSLDAHNLLKNLLNRLPAAM